MNVPIAAAVTRANELARECEAGRADAAWDLHADAAREDVARFALRLASRVLTDGGAGEATWALLHAANDAHVRLASAIATREPHTARW